MFILAKRANVARKQLSATLFRPTRLKIEARTAPVLAREARRAASFTARRIRMSVPYLGRMLVDFFQGQDPLAREVNLPSVSLIIPCHTKDFSTLAFVIEAAMRASRNPIAEVVLITPATSQSKLQSDFPQAIVLSDNEVLGEGLLASIRGMVPSERFGWALQQLVKFMAVSQFASRAALIVDADTVLLSPTTFLSNDGRQLLSFSHEFHKPYVEHTERVWPVEGASTGMSFVTHSQLMQREIVDAMFPDREKDLLAWLKAASWTSQSAFSEYHSYGTFLTNRFPQRIFPGVWGNTSGNWNVATSLSGSISDRLASLEEFYRGARSVSFHSYLR
jgi:hypothetical protein